MPAFTYDPEAEKKKQARLLGPDDICINPDTHPDQVFPAETVAGWCRDAAEKVNGYMPPLVKIVKRWTWLSAMLDDPANHDKPGFDQAQERFWNYWRMMKEQILHVLEWEWNGHRCWELLTPEQRVRFDLHTAWAADPEQRELIGHAWKMPCAAGMPETFDIKEAMGYIYTAWTIMPWHRGLQEYVLRGWLRGAMDLRKAQETQIRKEMIAAAVRERRWGYKEYP